MNTMARGLLSLPLALLAGWSSAADVSRHYSHSDARYLHHIDLVDIDNRKITAESERPYSPLNTCGRCHDYESIAHGWHFNAFLPESPAGRRGEPWIWTDPRTATQLPLSYRSWEHTYDPDQIGLSTWQMAHHFGGRVPGITLPPAKASEASEASETAEAAADAETEPPVDRWKFSGDLQVDCMICHAVSGAYDFNQRREQIEDENFAWAPTAGLRLGSIEGAVSRIKDDADLEDESVQKKMPTVRYDARRFGPDGTVFMDLVRKPTNNACYQCHSTRTVGEDGIEQRWIHDQDVHLRAGMQCADCHRNGIDHHIVRGYAGEENPSGQAVSTLSCQGCHLGDEPEDADALVAFDVRAGRMGAPLPLHRGLPPVHFEKLSCTACHGGPAPRDEALRVMTSLAHGLGTAEHRSGDELPAILAPIYTKLDDGKIHPHKGMWPAFWGHVQDGRVEPLNPETVHSLTRRSLRVRKDFVQEILQPQPKSSELKELLGEDCARVEEQEWTEEEAAKVAAHVEAAGKTEFEEKVAGALEALEQELDLQQAVYVASGVVYARSDDEDDALQQLTLEDSQATEVTTWPMAHNVRPAGWSLGAKGCVECHRDDGLVFASTVTADGPLRGDGPAIAMADLQGLDANQRLAWNQLFGGRSAFKYVVGGSLVVLLAVLLIGLGTLATSRQHRHSTSQPD